MGWHGHVQRHRRAHDQGADGAGPVDHEDQGRGPAGAQVLRVDWRLHPVVTEHLPADVDLQGRVRRVWSHDCAQEVLLSACAGNSRGGMRRTSVRWTEVQYSWQLRKAQTEGCKASGLIA